ncbi:replication factor C large subunit [Candidatus Bathycorpusculum sp.]|jgi:replication factor C large subunit|uniref:replication factor C large subunit n=1 Tax=Candidatus Bathycorpusculum sp. TaxID=2994959 RepID=UPI002836D821|nr:replication factor C large subunit [Candidatus Termitimicrobium sp.]MCL2431275.1 replication factor C large subunit [Candidatus Termitimicrobium sp.]
MQAQTDLLWVEKYRPKKIDDITGNDEAKALFLEWLKNKRHTKKAVLLYGPPGVGKTALVLSASRELGFSVIEMNASDTRSEKAINAIAKPATSYKALDNFTENAKVSGNVLFLDEVDGIAGNEDRGGVNAILKIIEASLVPIIMAANDPDIEKLRPLKKECLLIRFQQVRIPLIIALLQKICLLEHITAEFEALERIAQNSKGDVRSAINDLQSLSEENHRLSLQDTMMLTSRNKDISMDETLRRYFSTQNIAETSTMLAFSSVDYDDFLLSISDNLPKRYTDLTELAKAYDYISHADLFRGRIGTENWHLLKYFYNALAEASAVNPQSYKPFTFVTPPIRIITLFWTKGKRTMLDTICGKIGAQCHVSHKTAKHDFVPYIRAILQKKPKSPLVVWFKFTPEEVDFLTKMSRY